jgi:hypothetical protein
MGTRAICEICSDGTATAFDFEGRRVQLCRTHADAALGAAARTFEELRGLFVEPQGRRALLTRRAKDERRVFPPRPEGRRHDDGRRQSDD